MEFYKLEQQRRNLIDGSPGLLTETSLRTGELCGQHAATRIMSKITSPPTPIPRNAAFEIEAAKKKKERVWFINDEVTLVQLNEDNIVHTSLFLLKSG